MRTSLVTPGRIAALLAAAVMAGCSSTPSTTASTPLPPAKATSTSSAWASKSLDLFQGSSSHPSTSPDLRVGGYLAVIEMAPALLAAERFNAGGGKVHNAAIPALLKGELDIAANAETQALRASVARPDLRIIVTMTDGFYRIVGRRSHGINTLADLRGKKIGTVKDSSSAYYLHKMLQSVGMSEDDVTIVPIFPLDLMPQALARGEVDAITIWEPEIENAKAAIGADAIEFQSRAVYRELYNLNTTAAHLSDPNKRAQIVAYLRDLIAASDILRQDPASAWPIVARASGQPQALVEAVWEHEGFPAAMAKDLLDVMVDQEAWLAKHDGRPARSRDQLAALIDASVLAEALQPAQR